MTLQEEENKQEGVAKFETAIDAAGYGLFNVLVQLMAMLALFAIMFESSSIAFILPVAECDLKLTMYDKGILNAAGYAGMIASAIIWGYLADTQGRRIVLLVGILIDALCMVLSGLSQNFISLAFFKFVGGFFINGPNATIFTYLCEVHGAKHRESAIMFSGMWASVGCLVSPLLAWAIFPTNWSFTILSFLKIKSWQIFLIISAIPSIICGILMIYLPESPKFLMSQGRNSEALRVFRKMYALNTRQPPESFPIKRLVEEVPIYTIEEIPKDTVKAKKKTAGIIIALHTCLLQVKSIFTKPLLGHAFHAFLMQFYMTIGHITIRLWLPQLFASYAEYEALQTTEGSSSICEVLEYSVNKSSLRTAHVTPENCLMESENNYSLDIYMNNIIVAVSGIFGYFFAGFAVKFLGHKGMCMYGLLISGVLCISLYWSSSSLSTLIISSLYLTISMIASSSLLGMFMELFPTTLRTVVVSLALMFARIGGLSGNILFPYLMEWGCLPPFLLCGSMLLCAGLLAIILPKTGKDII